MPVLQRDNFQLPTNSQVGATALPESSQDLPCVYLCGNSLGVLPKKVVTLVNQELDVWGTRAVNGHFDHPFNRPWMSTTDLINPLLAELVGARTHEVACMGGLTNNLHLMMTSFYKPSPTRYKILCEKKAFPSDQYAFASQASLHGFDPSIAVLELEPREGEHTLREEDILAVIAQEGPSIALVIFPGVQYYTGQWFGIERITHAAREQGCTVGWDLAHAIGNVPLQLHDWGVDFAVWCSYKYLNAGPGAIAGLFVHEKWADSEKPKMAGWWGHDPVTRFAMPPTFSPIRGAQGFQQSNPCILSVVSLLASLEVFKEAGMMSPIRQRSVGLTARLESRLKELDTYVPPDHAEKVDRLAFTIITPSNPAERGAQLSLVVLPMGRSLMPRIFAKLGERGVIGDEREPDVIRLAPVALYNTESEVDKAVEAWKAVYEEVAKEGI